MYFIAAGVRWGHKQFVSVTRGGRLRKSKYRRVTAAGLQGQARDAARYIYPVTAGRKEVTAGAKSVLFDAASGTCLGRMAKGVPPNPFIQRTFAGVAGQVQAMVSAQAGQAIAATVAAELAH